MARIAFPGRRGKLSLLLVGGVVLSSVALVRCGGSSATSSNVAVAGILTQASRSHTRGVRHGKTLDLTTLSVYCVTFSQPPSAGSGTVGADGSFNVTINDAANKPFGCFVVVTATNQQLATLVIKDTSSTGLNGSSSTTTQLTAGGGSTASLGTVTLDTVTGEATATAATVTGTVTAAPTTGVTDFTGAYTIAATDSATAAKFPTYTQPCAQGSSNCHGPELGQSIYVKILHGTAFTADSTCTSAVQTAETNNTTPPANSSCNGTAGGDKYGIMVWSSQAAMTSCGNKLGFYYSQAKVHGGIDLSAIAGLSEGPMTWSSTAVGGGNLTGAHGALDSNPAHIGYGWADTAVTYAQGNYSGQPPQDCSTVTIGSTYNNGSTTVANPHSGSKAWACRGSTDMTGSTAANVYNISLSGGCYLTSSPSTYVQPTSNGWTTLNGVSGTNGSADAGGMVTNTKSAASVEYQLPNSQSTTTGNVTCTWTGGQFDDSAGTTVATIAFNTTHVLAAASTACNTSLLSGSTNAEKLAAMQCLSNTYQQIQNNYRNNDTVCLPEVRFNWQGSTVNDFLLHDGPQKAINQFVLELFNYTSNTSGTFTQSNDDMRGARDANGNWIGCQTHNNTTMNLTQISGTSNLLATFVQNTVVTDSNPACQSAQVDGAGMTQQIFQLTHN